MNVQQNDGGNIRTFTALADDAVLNVSDIRSALQAGLDVVVSTGSGGGSTGNIVWQAAASLSLGDGQAQHSITLQTDELDAAREVDIKTTVITAPLSVHTGGSDGLVSLDFLETDGGDLTVLSGDAGIKLNSDLNTDGGNLSLTGNVLLNFDVIVFTNAGFSLAGPRPDGSLSISGTIDGYGQKHDLTLRVGKGTMHFGGDLGGVQDNLGNVSIEGNLLLTADRTFTLDSFTLSYGTLDLAGHKLTMATGTMGLGVEGTLTGTGTVEAGFVGVGALSVVAPGAVNTPGELQIFGNIEFAYHSQLRVGSGANLGRLHVTGSVQLDSEARLTGASGLVRGTTGPIVIADGGVSGTFAQQTAVLGYDAYAVSYTATTVQIAPIAAGPNRVVGAAPDGTLYTITLTGGGNARLVVLDSDVLDVVQRASFVPESHYIMVAENGQLMQRAVTRYKPKYFFEEEIQFDIVVRNATLANQLIISAIPNGGSGALNVQHLVVSGNIGAIRAGGTSVNTLLVSGFLENLKLAAMSGLMHIGGKPSRTSSLAIKRIQGDITSTSAIGTLSSNEVLLGTITAPTIGTITTTVDRVNSLFGDFNATLVLDAGSRKSRALGSASIAGGITDSTWDIRGSLGDITVKQLIQGWHLGSADGLHAQQLGSVHSLVLTDVLESSIVSKGNIGMLTATTWNGTNGQDHNTIQAHKLGVLRVTDTFFADLILDAGFNSSRALGAATLGALFQSHWNIRGVLGDMIVKKRVDKWTLEAGANGPLKGIKSLRAGTVQNSSLTVAGRIGALTAASWQGGQVQAGAIGTLKITGEWNADMTLDAGSSTSQALTSAHLGSIESSYWTIRGSLGQVTVNGEVVGWNLGGDTGSMRSLSLGNVLDSSVSAAGRIENLTAANWQELALSSAIFAGSIGNLEIEGELKADVFLNAGNSSKKALGSAHIGDIYFSNWNIVGSLGTVVVDDFAWGWALGSGQLGSVGSVWVGNQLKFTEVHVQGRIGSIRAAQMEGISVTARSLGRLIVTGNRAASEAGDLINSWVTLTGANKGVGLEVVRIAGSVADSTFNVLGGNVNSFTCGSFLGSNLYVGYTPPASDNFDDLGVFLDPFRLLAFTTTAMPLVPHQSNFRTDAFQDSRIVANSFGKITLTGVSIDNDVSFGLRVNGAANAGTVLIGTAPFHPGIPVQPGTIKGSFEFLDS